jgi:hypothetical protein
MGSASNEMWKTQFVSHSKEEAERYVTRRTQFQLEATGLHIYKAVVFGMSAQPRGNISNEFYIHLDVIINYPHLSLYKRRVPTICSTPPLINLTISMASEYVLSLGVRRGPCFMPQPRWHT